MIKLKSERPASQIWGRTQWWQCGNGEALVSFERDEARCMVCFTKERKDISADDIFDRLDLSHRPGFSLTYIIDGRAILCPPQDVEWLLESVAAQIIGDA